MTTEADEQLSKARESVETAIQALSQIVVSQCWGTEDYNKDFAQSLQETLVTLLEIRKRLTP